MEEEIIKSMNEDSKEVEELENLARQEKKNAFLYASICLLIATTLPLGLMFYGMGVFSFSALLLNIDMLKILYSVIAPGFAILGLSFGIHSLNMARVYNKDAISLKLSLNFKMAKLNRIRQNKKERQDLLNLKKYLTLIKNYTISETKYKNLYKKNRLTPYLINQGYTVPEINEFEGDLVRRLSH